MRALRPGHIVLLGFAGMIAIGTVLLMLPISRVQDDPMPWKTALFTATSAVSVTGHVIVDTDAHWSSFGHLVILGLIQVGGFGIVTAAAVIFLILGRSLGLRGRMLTQRESKAVTSSDVRRVLVSVIIATLLVESAVAAVLTMRFFLHYDMSFGDSLWNGIFHAVSGFNNAGFSLFPGSMEPYRFDAWILGPIGVAIVVGGVGFPVIMDVWRNRKRRRLSLHSKLTLVGTSILLFGGTIAMLITEWSNPRTLGPMSVGGKVLNAWFQSDSARTAGFASLDVAAFRDETLFSMDVLMFIGGGSGSTTGGIKVATFMVLFLIVLGEARGGQPAEAFGRRIPQPIQRQALAIAFIALSIITIATTVMMMLTPFSFDESLFEVISASSTVGISTGITPELGTPAQLLLVALMYLGRVGPLALILALAGRQKRRLYDYPEESPLVG